MSNQFKIPVKEVVLTSEEYHKVCRKLEKLADFEDKMQTFFKNLAENGITFENHPEGGDVFLAKEFDVKAMTIQNTSGIDGHRVIIRAKN